MTIFNGCQVTQDIETLDIAGRILGSSACLMSWLASATDVWRTVSEPLSWAPK